MYKFNSPSITLLHLFAPWDQSLKFFIGLFSHLNTHKTYLFKVIPCAHIVTAFLLVQPCAVQKRGNLTKKIDEPKRAIFLTAEYRSNMTACLTYSVQPRATSRGTTISMGGAD